MSQIISISVPARFQYDWIPESTGKCAPGSNILSSTKVIIEVSKLSNQAFEDESTGTTATHIGREVPRFCPSERDCSKIGISTFLSTIRAGWMFVTCVNGLPATAYIQYSVTSENSLCANSTNIPSPESGLLSVRIGEFILSGG